MAAKKSSGSPPSKAVSAKANGALTVAADLDKELLGDQGKGFEEAGREAFAVPFLRILQDLSPQVKKKMSGYVEGATPGMIFNTVSQELFEKLRVIPCHWSQSFIEWTPRDKGGGLVAVHPPGSRLIQEVTREGSRNILPNGNELMDTRSHFVLFVRENGTYEGGLIAMASTGLKISRRWMSQMKTAVIEIEGKIVQPPMFAWSYELGSEEEANDQGSWYQWTISDRERVTDLNLYRAAKQFGLTMKGGTVKVNYEEELRGQAGGAGRGGEVPGDLHNEIEA